MSHSRREWIKSVLGAVAGGIGVQIRPVWVSLSCLSGFGTSACRGDSKMLEEGVNPAKAAVNSDFMPKYALLQERGELKKRGDALWEMMKECALCPRECGVNRLEGEKGFCGATSRLDITNYSRHFGEERPLVGEGGSGTIFMTHCGLRCVFCINWQVSQGGAGRRTTVMELAGMMLRLQEMGCHNINIVTPTHYAPHVVHALGLGAALGLRLPLVYNTCGWEKVEILELLDGIVDIYMPDFKYADGDMAETYSRGAATYPEITQKALLEMHRQVGVAKPARDGLMYSGLMIRHLVMPNDVGGTKKVLKWIAEHLPANTYINIMSQYRPVFEAKSYPKIARKISREEYKSAVKYAKALGLSNLDIQGYQKW